MLKDNVMNGDVWHWHLLVDVKGGNVTWHQLVEMSTSADIGWREKWQCDIKLTWAGVRNDTTCFKCLLIWADVIWHGWDDINSWGHLQRTNWVEAMWTSFILVNFSLILYSPLNLSCCHLVTITVSWRRPYHYSCFYYLLEPPNLTTIGI